MRSEAEVADVTGIVNDIRQSVFRHQNVGGGYRLPCSPLLRCLIFRSFSLKVSAGVRDGKKYREYSLKIIKVKKMRVTPGDETRLQCSEKDGVTVLWASSFPKL